MLHLILFYYFSIILVYFMMIILFYSTYYHCRYFILDISEVHCIIIDIEIINVILKSHPKPKRENGD